MIFGKYIVFGKGKTRFVIAFPGLGLVLKFPIIHFNVFFIRMMDIKKYGWRIELTLYIEMWKIRTSNPFSHKHKLLAGIVANWLEWKFWNRTKHPLLIPTWFSFFGLLNIQEYEKPLPYEGMWIADVVDKVTNGASYRCGHGFESPANYTEMDSCLRMIDYGSPKLWPVIIRYGKKIMKVTVAECQIPPDENETI